MRAGSFGEWRRARGRGHAAGGRGHGAERGAWHRKVLSVKLEGLVLPSLVEAVATATTRALLLLAAALHPGAHREADAALLRVEADDTDLHLLALS